MEYCAVDVIEGCKFAHTTMYMHIIAFAKLLLCIDVNACTCTCMYMCMCRMGKS